MAEVARLEPVDLRNVWPNEASDFTPWLADNLDVLGDALDLEDVEHVETEAPVGSFSLDIRAKDADGRAVVIENQLGRTDHDHLGKILTYAAGFDAGAVVWVAREFRDEHRAALDWLNQRTGLETEFYGVVVRAVKIDNSRPAYVFDVVARPNEFRKRPGPNPDLNAYQQFWERIAQRLSEDGLTRRDGGGPNNWLDIEMGVKGIFYDLKIVSGKFYIQLYISSGWDERSRERNKRFFDRLYGQRDDIESAFGEKFNWRRLERQFICRIHTTRPGRITDSQEKLDGLADWMVRSVVKIHANVIPLVREAAEAVDGEMTEESDIESLDDDAGEDEE